MECFLQLHVIWLLQSSPPLKPRLLPPVLRDGECLDVYLTVVGLQKCQLQYVILLGIVGQHVHMASEKQLKLLDIHLKLHIIRLKGTGRKRKS